MKLLPFAALTLYFAAHLPAVAFGADEPSRKPVDRSDAYYFYSMGHLYSELAEMYGNRGEYLSRAIDYYKQALKADPGASSLNDELAGLYYRAGRINEAVTELQDRISQDPKAVDARRVLGRIYLRLIGDQANNRINQEMLKRALEQYQAIVEIDPKDSESWLMLGRLRHIAKEPAEAEKSFQRALDLDPDSEDAMTGLAMVYSSQGDNQRAVAVLKQLADRSPNLRTLTTLVDAYESLRDYASAAEVLQRALELDPSDLELKRGLAQNLQLADKLDEALKVYAELAQDEPRNPEAYLRMSQIYRQKNDAAKAREALNSAKKVDPENVEVQYAEVGLLEFEGRHAEAIALLKQLVDSTEKRTYNVPERANRLVLLERLGLLYRTNEDYNLAVEAFRKMSQLEPDAAPRAAVQITDVYRDAKDYNRALQEIEAAAKKFPEDRMVGLKRASVLAELGKGDQAAAEVQRLFGDDRSREYWFSLAEVYERSKNYPLMAKALEEAAKLVSGGADELNLHFMRGAMYERMKQFELAEKEFRKALDLDPDNASILNYLGYMLADQNTRLDEAHKMINRALELDPHNGAYLDSLGWVYYRMGRLEEAESYLRRALQRISRDPTIRDHLGDVLFRMGRLKEAIVEWELALKDWDASAPTEKDPAETARIVKKLEGARVRLAQESSGAIRQR